MARDNKLHRSSSSNIHPPHPTFPLSHQPKRSLTQNQHQPKPKQTHPQSKLNPRGPPTQPTTPSASPPPWKKAAAGPTTSPSMTTKEQSKSLYRVLKTGWHEMRTATGCVCLHGLLDALRRTLVEDRGRLWECCIDGRITYRYTPTILRHVLTVSE